MVGRGAVSLEELRAQAAAIPPAPEFAISAWIRSANTIVANATAQLALPDDRAAEDAYRGFKRAAEIVGKRIPAHPHYKAMLAERGADLTNLTELKSSLLPVGPRVTRIADRLAERDRLAQTSPPKQSQPNESIQVGDNYASSTSRQARSNSTASTSSLRSPTLSSSPVPSTSSLHDLEHRPTMADRFAALRSAGMQSGPPLKSQPPSKPPKPDALSANRLVNGSNGRREGHSPEGSPKLSGREAFHSSVVPNGSSSVRSSKSRERDSNASGASPDDDSSFSRLQSLPSPSSLNSAFPSIDGFEASFPSPSLSSAADEAGYHFPAVPDLNPGKKPPLPPPPRPFDMDLEQHRKQRVEETEAENRERGRTNRAPPKPPLPNGIHRPIAVPAPRPPLPSQPTANAVAKTPIPFTNDVTPAALYNFLVAGNMSRVLLLDVRTKEEFERGRIMGNVVCLEPITIRSGVSSSSLESSLVISPPSHQSLFASRHNFEVVVIYDRSSSSIPTSAPHSSTSSEAQRILWDLFRAIYVNEFTKSLKLVPVFLTGGWEAWEKVVGERGIVRGPEGSVQTTGNGIVNGRGSGQLDGMDVEEFGKIEARKAANRKATIGPPLIRPPLDDQSNFSPNFSAFHQTSSIQSPRLAMPPTAVQRADSRSNYDAAIPLPPSAYSSRPSYPQPSINDHPSASMASIPLAGGGLTRTKSEFGGDMHAQTQSFSGNYSIGNSTPRGPIDYPRLSSTSSSPAPPQARPNLPYPVPLTRPPAIQPAPIRSNSSLSGLSLAPYASASSAMLAQNARFAGGASWSGIGGEDWIGLTGLKNLGNTCYMNSTIQCLSATIPFARYFKDGSFKKDINYVNKLGTKGALALAVSDLIRSLWAEDYNFLAPVTFREQICLFAPQFRGSDQHDAQEFLGFLLDGLHEDLNYVVYKPKVVEMTPERERELETLPQQVMSLKEWDLWRKRGDSFVAQGFQGQFRNMLKCLTCGKTSTTYNTFMPLSVPVPSGRGITKVTLDQCISAFVREEILEKDDAWFCPRCKTHRKASKKLTISRLPPILIVHLKRFSFKGPFSDKVETQVQYPLSGLDLTSYVPPPLFDQTAPPMTSPPKGLVYDLYAVTNHYGNLSSGHYTAYIRNNRDWFGVGDSKYSKVDPAQVQSARSAYILYYRLR